MQYELLLHINNIKSLTTMHMNSKSSTFMHECNYKSPVTKHLLHVMGNKQSI
jgi:hypothetical protein